MRLADSLRISSLFVIKFPKSSSRLTSTIDFPPNILIARGCKEDVGITCGIIYFSAFSQKKEFTKIYITGLWCVCALFVCVGLLRAG